jgi:hypothetical protein
LLAGGIYEKQIKLMVLFHAFACMEYVGKEQLMSMEIASSTTVGQEVATNKAQAGLDVLTKTMAKTEQQQPDNSLQRAQIAEQTGKGQNIDIKA